MTDIKTKPLMTPSFIHQTSGENEKWKTVDIITKKQRTPNYQYTNLNKDMMDNIQKKSRSAPFFMPTKLETKTHDTDGTLDNAKCLFNYEANNEKIFDRESAYKQKRFSKPQYVRSVNQKLVRNQSQSMPFCFLKNQDSPAFDDHCRGLSSVKWGPKYIGEDTRSHTFGEQVERYTMIDQLRRHPTNYAGRVVMDCGRVGDGYFAEKSPSRTTWFGSSVPLNRHYILPSVYRKSLDTYENDHFNERVHRNNMAQTWPEMSEYTDRFTLHRRIGTSLQN